MKIWLPFALIAACQLVALWLLLSFHRRELISIVLPVLHLFAGEAATHYPAFFFFLPLVFSRISLVLAVVVASIAVGAATLHFANEFGHPVERTPWKAAARRYPVLVLLTGILAALVWGVTELGGLIPPKLVWSNRMVLWGTRGGILLALVLIQSFFVYGTAWVVLRGNSTFSAIRDSILVTTRTFLPTLILVSLPALLLFPLSYLSGRIDLFSTKLRPETIAIILGGRIVLELFLGFLLVGAITRLFLWRLETAR